MTDLERAISSENLTISAGNISTYGMKRSLRVAGQFTRPEQIENIVLKSSSGAILYIKDVADVVDGFKEQESFSRLEGQNVITLITDNALSMGGTMGATAPMVDCIKLTTYAILTWDPVLGNY